MIFSELAMAYLESPRTFLTEKQYTGCERDPCEAIEPAVSPSKPDRDKFTTEELELVSEVVPAAPPREGSAEDHFPTCLHFLECSEPDICCFKAQVPLSKLKGLVDEWDVRDVTDFGATLAAIALCADSPRGKRPRAFRKPSSRA